MFVDVNGSVIPHDRQRLPLAGPPTGLPNGVYETMRIYAGARRPFLLPQHLGRLGQAARFLGIRNNVSGDEWEERIRAVLAANDLTDQDSRIRIMLFKDPTETRPRDCIAVWQVDHPSIVRRQTRGVTAVVASRRRMPGAELFQHKTLVLRGTQVAQEEANLRGAAEAVFLNERQEVCEATFSNIFAVVGGKLVTPPVSSPCLPGITRALVREIAFEEGFEFSEEPLSLQQLATASEAFLTSSVSEIVPLIRLDGRDIGPGDPGRITRLLQKHYHKWVITLRS